MRTILLKKVLCFCALILCALGSTPALADKEKDSANTAYILAFTDFHGRLEEGKKDPGIAKFMGAIRAFRAAHPNTLLLAAGDLFTGTVESDLLHGKPTFTALRSLNLAASAVGNHEFDWDKQNLLRWSKDGLPFLSANIKDAQGNPPPGIEQGRIFTVGNLRIGVVGLTTTSTARTTKQENVRHLSFAPPAAALAPVAAHLRKEGAEAIIVLAHLSGKERSGWKDGISPAIRELATVPGVTAVVYGHSHEEHLSMEGDVAIVQPAYRGRSLAIITLTRGEKGKVTAKAEIDALSQRKATLPVDSEGAAILRKAQEELGPAMDKVVAHAAHDLPHEENRPSLLGQIICQAMLDEIGGDVAIINDGGIRASLERGPVTQKHLYQVIPFDNRIMRMEMTGAELTGLLESVLGDKEERGIQAAGLTIRYDTALPKGHRITSMTLDNGTLITPETKVRVLTIDFLAKGGDGIPFPKLGRNKLLLEQRQREVLRDWMAKKGTVRQALKPWIVTDAQ